MPNALNDAVLLLVQEYGLKAVVNSLVVACHRQANFAAESGDETTYGDPLSWKKDAFLLDMLEPKIINSNEGWP